MFDAGQKCHLDPSDKSKDLNVLSKTNNVTHANSINPQVKKIKTTTINKITILIFDFSLWVVLVRLKTLLSTLNVRELPILFPFVGVYGLLSNTS